MSAGVDSGTPAPSVSVSPGSHSWGARRGGLDVGTYAGQRGCPHRRLDPRGPAALHAAAGVHRVVTGPVPDGPHRVGHRALSVRCLRLAKPRRLVAAAPDAELRAAGDGGVLLRHLVGPRHL